MFGAADTLDSVRKVLEGKMAFLTTVVNACMLWWVSSVVFCGSILSTTYVKRKELTSLKNLDWFAGIVAFFFLTIVVFGCGLGFLMLGEKNQMAGLLQSLNVDPALYRTEYYIFEWGIGLGTSSFVLVFITWVGIWVHLRSETKAAKSPQPSGEVSIN